MLRIVEKYFGGSVFDDAAGVENRNAIGKGVEDARIVGDENERHAAFGFQVGEELEDFGFGFSVEGSGRFVGDDQLRIAAQGLRDCDALLLAAAELMGIGVVDATVRRG